MIEDGESVNWGVSLNWRYRSTARNWPSWTTQTQREKWERFGVLFWDNELEQVTRISGTQALVLLDLLQNDWDTYAEGITIGEPAWRISTSNPDPKGEPVLINQMMLTSGKVELLFEFLSREEETLKELAEYEEREKSRILGQVYGRLVEIGRKRRRKQSDQDFDN